MKKSVFAIAAFTLILCACKQAAPARTEFVLGTICTVNLYDRGTDAIYTEIFDRLKELESILSANRDGTNLMDINAGAGIAPVKAAPETIAILSETLIFSEKTAGLLDPTIGPLVKAWNIGTDYAAVPPSEKRLAAMALVDYRKVTVDKSVGTVFLQTKGMKLDLGAVAKGYAARRGRQDHRKTRHQSGHCRLGREYLRIRRKKIGLSMDRRHPRSGNGTGRLHSVAVDFKRIGRNVGNIRALLRGGRKKIPSHPQSFHGFSGRQRTHVRLDCRDKLDACGRSLDVDVFARNGKGVETD